MFNPKIIKIALDTKNWLQKNPIHCTEMFEEIVPSKDGTGWVVKQQFKFATKKEAEIFKNLVAISREAQI